MDWPPTTTRRPPQASAASPHRSAHFLADGQLDTEVSEFYEETTVKFSELSEEMLWEYIDSGEPM